MKVLRNQANNPGPIIRAVYDLEETLGMKSHRTYRGTVGRLIKATDCHGLIAKNGYDHLKIHFTDKYVDAVGSKPWDEFHTAKNMQVAPSQLYLTYQALVAHNAASNLEYTLRAEDVVSGIEIQMMPLFNTKAREEKAFSVTYHNEDNAVRVIPHSYQANALLESFDQKATKLRAIMRNVGEIEIKPKQARRPQPKVWYSRTS